MAVKDKNTLKTYFESGDIPSQNQFEDLIDSFKHQDETFATLNEEQLALMANRLAAMDNGFISYYVDSEKTKILLDITQQNAPNQFIELSATSGAVAKRYFTGDAPYTVRLKGFQGENLAPTEYYLFNWQINQQYSLQRLFGNNLPNLPDGFEFGVSRRRFYFETSKQNIGQQVNIVPTHIKWINTTGVPIAYRAESTYWSDLYRTTDTVTDHYDAWDYLSFQFNADMTNQTQTIVCNLYDNDNGQLVQTTNLMPGQNYKNTWGGQVNGVRNVLIECTQQ